jgi:hypothetical protein
MLAILYLLGAFVANLFTSRRRLEVENLFLRHQLNIALRRTPHRLRLRGSDRALLVWMTWLWPGLLGVSPLSLLETTRAYAMWQCGYAGAAACGKHAADGERHDEQGKDHGCQSDGAVGENACCRV